MNAVATTETAVPLDKDLPQLALAMDREAVAKEFKKCLPLVSRGGRLRLKDIRVIRHKPGRRCVIEYVTRVYRPDASKEKVILIGKTRARRSGNEGFRLQKAIWDAGFDSESGDRISVPEPIGVISAFQMWIQRKVKGPTADLLLAQSGGVGLARRIAGAIHKLHCARVPTEKAHTIHDELRILRECLAEVALVHPQWAPRLDSLMTACEKRGAATPAAGTCGIHRDFYASQVIVEGDRLWLLDFDLYCQGDPALDAGNFIGHVTEQSLRECGSPDVLGEVERAVEDEFARLSGEKTRPALRLYRDLTLARHIFLSTKFPERQHTTERLLALCEGRLGGYENY
jgi:hypothetical protein